MTSTSDMLQTTLGQTLYEALVVLAESSTPMSGRMVASALGVAPTTATSALAKLREAGFAGSSREGRADRWHLSADNPVLRSWLAEGRDEPPDEPAGMSPYATGGGGVTFERKVAAKYLAHLLVGDAATELGDGRLVVGVAFQQAPEHSVDDLVIRAARANEVEPSLVLSIGVRRSPDLVQSDPSTRKLISAFLRDVTTAPDDDQNHRVALVVAGSQDHARQLGTLSDLAFDQTDSAGFYDLVRTSGKFPTAVRRRLGHIEALVRLALVDLGDTDPGNDVVQQHTWLLLSKLTVLMPRFETPDEADWAAVATALASVARGGDLYGASRLRDRLVALADEYEPKAASVDLTLLRRDAHEVLDSTVRRHRPGWKALAHLHQRAINSVRSEITSSDEARSLHLDRADTAAGLRELTESASAAVVAYGESGVGKSALVLRTAASPENSDSEATQAVCINLRHLPATTLEFESFLGVPLATLLEELSAPQRLLVIDGADAISEGMLEPLRYLIDAGLEAGLTVTAVATNETKQLVRDTIAQRGGGEVAEYLIPPLTDAEVDDVVATFSELVALAADTRSRELLRRPVVIDLLVRGGLAGTPLSDADAMRQVWSGLVRRHDQSDRGKPDARELALLRLGDLALCGGNALDIVGAIDPVALDGLRRDGLLRTSSDDPFRIGPVFAHDEVRRYAVAWVMLAAGNSTTKLVDAGVPRWALGAARLACQLLLATPDMPSNPLDGRFARLQEAFDDLVNAGHGARWGDVPGEALLTLGDPYPVLRDAWPELHAEPGDGLQRLGRLVDQRLRDANGLVRIAAIEPLIDLLLEYETPWRSGEHVQMLLQEWLRALVIADAPADYPLRLRLRERLAAASAAADRRMQQEREAADAARAARTAEEIEEERRFMDSHRALFTEIGYSRTKRRARREVPREITDEIVVELLALLGPDLGDEGEAILRRIGGDAPWSLRPAVEELFTGRALATYQRGFLAELTEAYYLDEEDDGSGFYEDGIRHHRARSFGVAPLAAWYRGPFLPLFQSDFRNGVATLNRLLNHTALVRARSLAGGPYDGPVDDNALDAYRTELEVTGRRRAYIGDEHVWIWYRGTGVGPYPCMSALQALERVCDQLIEIGMPLASIAATLLDGCENLAMVGLVVGLLMRHLEIADRLFDPYLAEPLIWHHEFGRVVQETSGLAAPSNDLVAPERRQWSIREAAMLLVLRADDARADELRTIGKRLVETARRLVVEDVGDVEGTAVEDQLVTVRAWASGLDRTTYDAHETEDGLYIESRPPDDIAQAMQRGNEYVHQAQEATRLTVRYYIQPKSGEAEPVSAEDLATDLAVAQELLDDPPALNAGYQWDAPTAVAATALEAHLTTGVGLPEDALRFAAEVVIRVGEGATSPHQFEYEGTFFEQGADRSAARALPLLLLPSAAALRALINTDDESDMYSRSTAAASNLARSVANEVRLHLTRALDRVWAAPCADEGICHHETALQLAIETMRDCAFGPWDPDIGQRAIVRLDDPVTQSLADTADDDIYTARLDAAIRALAPAAAADVCVSSRAREVLTALLIAHRRSLLGYEKDLDHRGTHALVAARALLTIAADGDETPIYEHIDAYADNATLLGSLLRALSAAAEESPNRATTARRIWPEIVSHVLDLQQSGHNLFGDTYPKDYALASLMPNAAGEIPYLYREVEDQPIVWWTPLAWHATVELWLPLAQGIPTCVDHLVSFLGALEAADQTRIGLPWIADLVLAEPSRIANRTYMLSSWLIEVRPTAADLRLLSDWQRVVDALVVSGVTRLAPYSE